ncbi:flagellar brake protein [Marinospirillum alkaliphilum]|uniref:C-di-GMP-binding flagellar brake protein YcgR, contains PilZNR and PilZ domains n=1 Tax=Marinospirillum alkaliphilum DSM 21637 TaxID=1122209 RepID=A0A1K1ZG89_9GAMM|nr:flagellar brake protein [Marinospirillum alkaliphilum]SFX73177.1 c-di-GMP-binding flagellar brake protein YcgR, contains PilZNR and PilZ domains [Marinospirillum alkaliphilum DSM 21637]
MAKSMDSEHIISRPAEIASILSSLQRHNAPVTVHFRDNDQSYVSMILAVDREQQVFYLDELNPPSGHKRAVAGEIFSVRGAEQGISIFFSHCKIEKLLDEEDGAVYKVPFPKTLMHNQKRDAFRAHVMRSMHVPVTLLAYERGKPIPASLLDISSTGCKLEFDHLVTPPFKSLEIFEELSINLPEFEKVVTLAVEARHAVYQESKERTTCGFRFINVDGRTQAEIDRFVIFLQREARRLDLR